MPKMSQANVRREFYNPPEQQKHIKGVKDLEVCPYGREEYTEEICRYCNSFSRCKTAGK